MAEGKRASRKPKKVAEGIYRMPSGNLQLRWYAGSENGKEKVRTKTIPGDTPRAEAIRVRHRELEKVAKRRKLGGGDEHLAGAVDRWLRTTDRWTETTRIHNEIQTRSFVRDFGHRQPATIGRDEARRWIVGGPVEPHLVKEARGWFGAEENDYGELVAPAHRNNLPVVRTLFNDLLRAEQVDRNPFAGLHLKQSRGRQDITVLEPEEVERLEMVARRQFPRFAAMIRFAAWTGLRPAELYALRWRDFDVKPGHVAVRRQYRSKIQDPSKRETPYLKTDHAHRDVPLLPQAQDALAAVPRLLDSDLVFTTETGTQLSARTASYYWERVRPVFWETLDERRKCPYCAEGEEHDAHERGTIPSDFDFYELRHFFATYAAGQRDVTPMNVAKWLGHGDGGKLAFKHYFHSRDDAGANALLRGAEQAREAEQERRQAQ